MKHLSLLFCFVLISIVAVAQDIIVTNKAERIEAVITEVSPTEIRYKKWDYQNGPTFVVPVSELNSIIYGNGDVQLFKQEQQAQKRVKTREKAEQQEGENFSELVDTTTNGRHRYINDVRFQGYIFSGDNFGFPKERAYHYSYEKNLYGPSLDFDFGVRIKDYFYVGFEFGTHFLLSSEYTTTFRESADAMPIQQIGRDYLLYFPLAASMKFYLPTKKQYIYPYLSFAVGGNLGIYGIIASTYLEEPVERTIALGGAFVQIGTGVDIKRLSLGVGYTFVSSKRLIEDTVQYAWSPSYLGNATIDGLYLKIGVRIGRL